MQLSVIGTGYLGATHAACMAELGHEVVGIDIEAAKVLALRAGNPPFFEPVLAELLARHNGCGLDFTADIAQAAHRASVHFITVGTPGSLASASIDTGCVEAVLRSLVPLLRGAHLIVGKSTVPVGTAERLERLCTQLSHPDADVELAWNPEFLREGHAVGDTLRPDRIVVGCRSEGRAAEMLSEVYADALSGGTPMIVTDFASAELSKLAANAFLATKVSFINAIAEVCEAQGGDVVAVAQTMGCDARIGADFLGSGLGFGGGCLPKDVRGFAATARENGASGAAELLSGVEKLNRQLPETYVDALNQMLGKLRGARVAFLGCAFKPGSDDVRESPALALARQLAHKGARVCMYDPQAMGTARSVAPELDYAESIAQVLIDADAIVLATEWPEFVSLDPDFAAGLVRKKNILDARNVMDRARWSGWALYQRGRRG
ncbi:UDP-glucose/GDP-mannose dehydrogenase family protein [Corynebacterium pseudotuberculosis]|uniref:UDP-glucose 6-dehydrogenase n=1 Tax=Corynebacterium pseudotuberculosis 258 TaxID=1168865 RepID=A0AAU8PP85_CORPS|nr:UDP-glucose/GDP-mannose dehydrogenase family protein [Corynebacterium pseudotuberculosis]AEQ07457.1 nucleotide sugar dehydrogenase [Corynebacterium pseudotuberculosis CIP 52.97]AFB73267.1 nucleotide sugar dehydrogenase [Corynebacterium pseudotuberculosis 316]AFK17564.1 nucleotide sugar dehydrogenase [Corynebacterium pseudotuberculosis 258]AKS14275.1 UDP-glucose 6-dehydrogenase [Corynebacterium pseudotuberculosis]AMN70753.1 nucleotide sugar dehydrogenase [Corynebacterium pseudotuberculosis]